MRALDRLDPSHRADLARLLPWQGLLLGALLLCWWLPVPQALQGLGSYAPLHALLETLSIIVSALIFSLAWGSRLGQVPANVCVLACAFAGVALLDFSHLLSYSGMPDYVTPAGPEKAIDFWLGARLMAVLGLLWMVALPWQAPLPRARRRALLVAVLLCVGLVHWVVLVHPELLPRTFIAGQGLTPLKIRMEYLLVAMLLGTALLLLWRMRGPTPFHAAALLGAVLGMAMSELFFTLYASVTDVLNLAGHVYKVIAYLFLHRAVFMEAVQRPYMELEQVRQQLQATLATVPDLVFEMDAQGRYLSYHSPPSELLAAPAGDFIGRLVSEVLPAEAAATVMQTMAQALAQGSAGGQRITLDLPVGRRHFELHATRCQQEPGQAPRLIVLSRDITLAVNARDALLEAAQHTQAILDNVVDGIITIDRQGLVLSVNRSASAIFGYEADEVIGRNIKMLMPAPYAQAHDGYLASYARTGIRQVIGRDRDVEVEGLRKNGEQFPMSLAVNEIEREGERVYIGMVRDITQRRAAAAEIQRLAFFDQLTELPNRRLLLDRLQRAVLSAARRGQLGALLFIDLDEFKLLNDTWGHDFGDRMLVQVAHRLSDSVREGDTVARLGGDEFVIMLESLGDTREAAASHAEMVARKILAGFEQSFRLQEREQHTTPSIGITLFGDNLLGAGELMAHADTAMYQAKSQGKNTFRFYDAELQAVLATRAALESELRQAIARQQLQLHFQPQVDDSGQLLGAEALLRWQHPDRGLVAPGVFIPVAEQCGFVLELGSWVLDAACRTLASWATLPGCQALNLSVNVSALQLRDPQFVTDVLKTIQRHGADPRRLTLELTESLLAENVEDTIAKMQALRDAGVGFSLDDFGTGYSSLNYLRRLPLEELKIDRSFVNDMLGDPNSAVIARTVVALGQTFGLQVIAEGVETPEQRDALLRIGCKRFQGYLFGRPTDQASFERQARQGVAVAS
ncbi:EAL domain-containing protein [Pelomonas sp. APW6]|uniref:EAL domain-containing protein n=1 Tax=Roseateles subflavus TaxID=3053353 RepID=A0ABT7LDP7_9BURK|nr:EAL domain-containing protein [Pelomonas sp. APW6]MDL5030995.1 EAL domain-containing protein [Pelomonas sp. APW6]